LLSVNRQSLIGVDTCGRFIRAVQLARTSGWLPRRGGAASPECGWRLAAVTRLPKSVQGEAVDRADVAQLCRSLARQGFSGTRISLAIPEDKIVTGILDLPPRASGAPLADIARLELASMNNYDAQAAETVSWDLPPSPRTKDATQAMAVACRHTDAEAMIEIFEGAGLQVAALDSRLHAVVRACSSGLVLGAEGRPLVSATGITGILDLEWEWAVMILLYKGTVIYRWSMGEAAVSHLSKAMAVGLGVDETMVEPLMMAAGSSDVVAHGPAPSAAVGACAAADVDAPLREAEAGFIRKHADSIAESIASPLLYAGQQYPGSSVDSLLVVGPGAAIPGVVQHLASHVTCSVKAVAPADLVGCPGPLAEKSRDPSLVSAVGLAEFGE